MAATKLNGSLKGAVVGRKRSKVDSSTYAGKIAARLRELREAKGLTVAELSDKTGIGLMRLYSYESHKRKIDPDSYPTLAKALGCKTVAEFFPPLK